jgi:hypothetical protein
MTNENSAMAIPFWHDCAGRILMFLSSLSAATFDAGLSLLLIPAYFFSRGWMAWRKTAEVQAEGTDV